MTFMTIKKKEPIIWKSLITLKGHQTNLRQELIGNSLRVFKANLTSNKGALQEKS